MADPNYQQMYQPQGGGYNPYQQYQQQQQPPPAMPPPPQGQYHGGPPPMLAMPERRNRDRDRDRDRYRDRDRDRRKDRDRDYRDRDRGYKNRERSRSPQRRRSPTPPSPDPSKPHRRRRKTFFDILPADMEAQAQMAPATQAGLGGSVQRGTNQQATRHARQVYVGGLPPTVNEQQIASFFSHALAAVGGNTAGPGESVVNVYINREKNFAFLEFRTVEECSNAMALDGIMFEGVSVRVRRPNDYNPQAAAALGPSVPSPHLNLAAIGLQPGGGGMADVGERIFVGGLPHSTTEEECRELLSSFGPIKSFDLVKDRETGNSKGYGFVVYADPATTNVAIEGLNGLSIGNRVLTVKRAADQPSQRPAPAAPVPGVPTPAVTSLSSATRIVVLSNAIDIKELEDDTEYGEIYEDMKDECSKYGLVKKITIPRPLPAGQLPPPGLGKVIVEYLDPNDSVKARNALHGRLFGGKEVQAVFLREDFYAAGQFDAIGL